VAVLASSAGGGFLRSLTSDSPMSQSTTRQDPRVRDRAKAARSLCPCPERLRPRRRPSQSRRSRLRHLPGQSLRSRSARRRARHAIWTRIPGL